MKTWRTDRGVEHAPDDVRVLHRLIGESLERQHEEVPCIVSIATCDQCHDDHRFKTILELAPGLMLSIAFGEVDDLKDEEDLVNTGYEPYAAAAAADAVRTYRSNGIETLGKRVHGLRLQARRILARSSAHGEGCRLLDVHLKAADWHHVDEFKVAVRLDCLDKHLVRYVETIEIDDPEAFDHTMEAAVEEMSSRFAARRALASLGATGSIDLVTARAIASATDLPDYLRRLSRRQPKRWINDLEILAEDGHITSRGLDAKTGLSWRANQVFHPTTIPESVLIAAIGRPLTDAIRHPYLSGQMKIVDASLVDQRGVTYTMLDFEQPTLLFCGASGRTWRCPAK